MAWKESCRVTERARFVLEWEREKQEAGGRVNMAALCRAFGIERQTGYKWLRRYVEAGRSIRALEDQSRRPKSSPTKTPEKVEAAIIRGRRMRPRWGARKLRDWLLRVGYRRVRIRRDLIPTASTVGAVLRRHGLTRPRKRRQRTPPYSEPFKNCDRPNSVWCVDFKGWFRTGDGSVCYPLTLTDAFSRKLLRCQVAASQNYESTRPIFESAFLEFGLPDAIRSDNGPPFASRALGGFSELSVWWAQLGIRHERIKPGHPQQNGRHERMHLTLKQETAAPPASTLRAQQQAFDQFKRVYNEERPHEALSGRVPADLYARSKREWPEIVPPFEYADDCEVLEVWSDGTVRMRKSRIRVGTVFAGQQLGFRWLAGRRWEVLFGPQTLGILDLLNNRVVGPSPRRAGGRPSKAENRW